MRGALIAVEGLDRTGKTTQTERLLDKLTKLNVKHKLVKFPQRETNIGKIINQYLTDKSYELNDRAIHLLFSANRWELADQIKKDLDEGYLIILDRYVYSGASYSTAKGLDFDWCMGPDKGLPRPDVTIFLKFENSENSNRSGFGDERYEVVEFQEKVSTVFKKFADNKEWKPIFVDGLGIDEVHQKVWNEINQVVDGVNAQLPIF